MRIVIAEDATIMREGLASLLADHGHAVVAAVPDADALRTAVRDTNPDIAIIDVRMPPTYLDEGLRAALAIRHAHPAVAVLIFSQYVETRYAAELLRTNPSRVGYLLKDRVADVADFLEALTRIAAGGTALDPEVVSQLLSTTTRPLDLTDRELSVLSLMAQGRSNAAIAAALTITEGAVEKHAARIFTKLDIPTTPQDNRRVLAVLRYLNP
jgi:DNA-binding NarL/FixJ family response regulator